MAAYLIIEIESIHNPENYDIYLSKVKDIILKFEGKYLLKSEHIIPFSGNWNPERFIIIIFPTIEKLKACFSSKEYIEIKAYRESSVQGKAMIIENN